MLDQALKVVRDTVAKGGRILFVGTKRQAQKPSPKPPRNARSST
jgi:small subunit ribosomal protein S2